ncbi:MAG: LapA family protein [Gammaproteobacteria bacterium]|nr:LapA family protein [Gammaproteobacteria bacterium]
MLMRIGVIALVLVIFVVMAWFTSINPGEVPIDLAFGTVQPSIPLALAVTFVLGWVFGILSMTVYSLKQANERRRLRAALKKSESEVTSLRSLPIDNAD